MLHRAPGQRGLGLLRFRSAFSNYSVPHASLTIDLNQLTEESGCPIHRRTLQLQSPRQLLNIDHVARGSRCSLPSRFRLAVRLLQWGASVHAGEEFRQRHPQNACDLGQVLEADVFLTALDLANVCSMEPAQVREFFLRPSPRTAKFPEPLAQDQ